MENDDDDWLIDQPDDRWIPDPEVRRRYSRTAMTLWRWDNDLKLGFPPPIKIRNRKYRSAKALAKFDRRRAAAADKKSIADRAAAFAHENGVVHASDDHVVGAEFVAEAEVIELQGSKKQLKCPPRDDPHTDKSADPETQQNRARGEKPPVEACGSAAAPAVASIAAKGPAQVADEDLEIPAFLLRPWPKRTPRQSGAEQEIERAVPPSGTR